MVVSHQSLMLHSYIFLYSCSCLSLLSVSPINHPRMLEQVLRTLALGTLITCTLADFSLFPNDTISSSVNLSTQCTNALTSSVACDPYLLQLSQSDYYGSLGDDSLQSSLCITSCGTSLVSYHTSVISSCANDAQPWLGIPAQTYGDLLWSTYNLTCLKDTGTGEWCNGDEPHVFQAEKSRRTALILQITSPI